jgi:hypothetical protein
MPLVIRQKSDLFGVLLKILDDDLLTRELIEPTLASSLVARTGVVALLNGVEGDCEMTLTVSAGIVSTIIVGVEGALPTGAEGACEAATLTQSSVESVVRFRTGY